MASKGSTASRTSSARPARTAHKPVRPFTVDHWRRYSRLMVLDNGAQWEPEEFQVEFARDVFSGVPEVWLIVPEGNGKTTLLSGIALYHADFTPDAAVPMAAASRDQCGLLLSQAAGFVRRTPGLERSFRVFEGYRRIKALRTNGLIQVFAADDATGDGIIPTLPLFDELHRHRSLKLYRTWRGKLDKRGGTLAGISTAGEPGSEFEVTRERARTEATKVRRRRNGRHLRCESSGMILHDFALRDGDDPSDLAAVKDANPFSGITVESLARKRESPSITVGHWRRFVCNLATRTEAAAVGEQEWTERGTDECPKPRQPCDVGLDIGWRWDTTALSPLFRVGDGLLLHRSKILVPPRDGNSMDPERITDAFEELHDQHPIERVVMDIAAGEEIAHWLSSDLGVEVVEHSQKSDPMADAAGKFMEGLRAGTLRHSRDPDLTRHVMNAVAYDLPDGRFKFVRPKQSRTVSDEEQERRVIDGLISSAMVVHVASAAPVGGGVEFYS